MRYHGMDTNPLESTNKGIARVNPKDGPDHSRTRGMSQRVDLRMCESASPHAESEKLLVHLTAMERLLGTVGVLTRKALLRRSRSDARRTRRREAGRSQWWFVTSPSTEHRTLSLQYS